MVVVEWKIEERGKDPCLVGHDVSDHRGFNHASATYGMYGCGMSGYGPATHGMSHHGLATHVVSNYGGGLCPYGSD